jgi:hypothetical protein
MSTEKARPMAQPPAPKKPTSTETAAAIRAAASVRITKEQEDFEPQANALAASLGWDGEPEWVLNGIQVGDARRFLAKTLHEVHVAALNNRTPPTALSVCSHLGLDADTHEVVEALAKTLEQERGKPATPTS